MCFVVSNGTSEEHSDARAPSPPAPMPLGSDLDARGSGNPEGAFGDSGTLHLRRMATLPDYPDGVLDDEPDDQPAVSATVDTATRTPRKPSYPIASPLRAY